MGSHEQLLDLWSDTVIPFTVEGIVFDVNVKVASATLTLTDAGFP